MRLFALLIERALVDTQFAPIGALLNADLEMTSAVFGLSFLVAVLSSLVPAVNLSGRPVVTLAGETA